MMNSYKNYISEISNACLVADYDEHKIKLKSRRLADAEVLTRFCGIAQQLDCFEQADPITWLSDSNQLKEVENILGSWDKTLIDLGAILLIFRDHISDGVPKTLSKVLADKQYYIYQTMKWSEVAQEKDELEKCISNFRENQQPPVDKQQEADKIKSENEERSKTLDERYWKDALLENTVSSYKTYIQIALQSKWYELGNKCHIAEAEEAIHVNKEQEADRVKSENEERSKTLDEQSWKDALLENTVSSYQAYIQIALQSKWYELGNKCHIAEAEEATRVLTPTKTNLTEPDKIVTPIPSVPDKNVCGKCGEAYPPHYSRCPKDGFLFSTK